MTQNVEGTIGHEGIGGLGRLAGQVKVSGSSTGARCDDGQVGVIAFDDEQHVAGGKADGGVGMSSSTIVEQLGASLYHCLGAADLFRC